jgi:D-lactate dehydrogenase
VRDLNFSLNGLVGFDLHGKTAGIFGTGKIGRVAAQILRGFGMKVLAFDPFPSPEWAKDYGVEAAIKADEAILEPVSEHARFRRALPA